MLGNSAARTSRSSHAGRSAASAVGTTTSGGYAHHLGKSLAIGYVRSDLAEDGTELALDILGERRPAVVRCDALYDPQNERLRS